MCNYTQQGIRDLTVNREERFLKYQALKTEYLQTRGRVNPAPGTKDAGESLPENLDIERQLEILNKQILQMDELLRTATVVDEPIDIERARIGHNITIQRFDSSGAEVGKPERYRIGSYQSTDLKTMPPTLSYDAPIIALHLGRRVGNVFKIHLNGCSQESELLKIEMPSSRALLRAVS